MTREQLIKHWDTIVAFKEGKELQARSSDAVEWRPCVYPKFYVDVQYRIKPEPVTVEVWRVLTPGRSYEGVFLTEEGAKKFAELAVDAIVVKCTGTFIPPN